MAFEQVSTILDRLREKEEAVLFILKRYERLDGDPRWEHLSDMLASGRETIRRALDTGHRKGGSVESGNDAVLDSWIQNPPEIESLALDPLPDDASPDALVQRAVELEEDSREACRAIVEGAQTPPRVRETFERLLSLYEAESRKSAWNALQQEDV